MDWVFLSLASAFFLATSDALAKKAVQDESEYLVAWFRLLFTLPILAIILLFIPWPELDRDFYMAFIIALPVELITIILYVKALKLSPLSLTVPFLALTPVFLVTVSYVLLGEEVSPAGAAGILLIAAGGYILNIDTVRRGLFEPVRSIIRDRGALLMIAVALLYSITSSLGKMAITHSSPLFFGASYFIALSIAFLPIALLKGRGSLAGFIKTGKYKRLLYPGVFYALMIITHMQAMKLTKVAYMISVKRTSLLISVIYGYFLFQEENIRGRFFGALLMFAGFVLVVTAQ
jgi:drug/metabolite transporter (DMT)-like permease